MRLQRVTKMSLFAVLSVKLLLCLPIEASAQDLVSDSVIAEHAWGDFRGQILVEGAVPPPVRIETNKDRVVCGVVPLFDESLIVSDAGGLKDVVVMLLQSQQERQEPAIHPDYLASEADVVEVVMKNCRFEPHVVALTTRQKLVFVNQDEVGHSPSGPAEHVEWPVESPGIDRVEQRFRSHPLTPFTEVCSAHPWMHCVVLVREEPHFAVTNEAGEFEIKSLPAGKWKFVFWHQRGGRLRAGGYLMNLTREGESIGGRLGEIEVEIKAGETTDWGKLLISAENLMPMPQ